jgi:hypothetical protein
LEDLQIQSRRLNDFLNRKVFGDQEQWIMTLRKHRKPWERCIQHELKRYYDLESPLATIKIAEKHSYSKDSEIKGLTVKAMQAIGLDAL